MVWHDQPETLWEGTRDSETWLREECQTCAGMVQFEVVIPPTVHPQFTHSSLTVHTTVHSQFTHVIYGVLVSRILKDLLKIKT